MIVTTELYRLRVEEIARGRFRFTTLDVLAPPEPTRSFPCAVTPGKYHRTGCNGYVGHVEEGDYHALSLRVGGHLVFSGDNVQLLEPCCGHSHRIESIEP